MELAAHNNSRSLPSVTAGSTSALFELIDRLQSSRIDDQRCSLPASLMATSPSAVLVALRQQLQTQGPHPMVFLVNRDKTHFWVEPDQNELLKPDRGIYSEVLEDTLETELHSELDYQLANCYRTHFLGCEHHNFVGQDDLLGPLVLSIKRENGGQIRALLRLTSGSVHRTLNCASTSPVQTAQMLNSDVSLDALEPVLWPGGSEAIANFDEHVVTHAFKFGVIYQKKGQITEEALLSNKKHSAAFDEFLSLLGQKVRLREHRGYRGGLDCSHGSTGDYSVYEVFANHEIMFHVSTLLPFKERDRQQVQRKRHIGNDIVALVFQDGETPFHPSMLNSHFLHAFIVVQVLEPCSHRTRYKVSVVARSDVPNFGPQLPKPAIFKKGNRFKRFLLAKLIRAEWACLKSEKFDTLRTRTRHTLLNELVQELSSRTELYTSPISYKFEATKENNNNNNGSNSASVMSGLNGSSHNVHQLAMNTGSAGLISSVKKALTTSKGSRSNTGPVVPEGRFLKIAKHKMSHELSLSENNVELVSTSLLSANTRLPMRVPLIDNDAEDVDNDEEDVQDNVGNNAENAESANLNVGTGRSGDSGHGDSEQTSGSECDAKAKPSSSSSSSSSTTSTSSPVSRRYFFGAAADVFVNGDGRPHHNHSHNTNLSKVCSVENVGSSVISLHAPTDTLCGRVTHVQVSGRETELDRLQEVVTQLRVDKLELMRINVNNQHELQRMRERELDLQAELVAAGKEIRRLRRRNVNNTSCSCNNNQDNDSNTDTPACSNAV